MQNQIAGAGLTLPLPQNLYPFPLSNGNNQAPTNEVSLAAGQSVIIPPGEWICNPGKYGVLQYQDPVNQPNISQYVGVWRTVRAQRGTFQVRSDGVNYRILNPLGVPVAAIVTKGGANYTQAGTTVTASSGNSTWQAIIGGRVSLSLTAFGSGYGVAPVVNIVSPAGPAVAATAVATISTNGRVDSITLINEGAGYASAPTVVLTPSPFDPNVTTGAIQTATATALLTGSGTVSAILCTNNGASVGGTAPTLTIAGGNSSATATALLCTTITAVSATALGSGTITGAFITTAAGQPTATAVFTNPAVELTGFVPTMAQINISVGANGALTGTPTITDGGMFLGTPLPLIITYGGAVWNPVGTVTLTQGATSDTLILQPT